MNIPIDAEIPTRKITEYLLKQRDESDKSQYLTSAGYSVEKFEQLILDLREQILPLEATFIDTIEFGEKYEIVGTIVSPTEKELFVKTIWMLETTTNRWKFITLFPAERG